MVKEMNFWNPEVTFWEYCIALQNFLYFTEKFIMRNTHNFFRCHPHIEKNMEYWNNLVTDRTCT
jgi:hypothetical protein